ncbi:MAG: hypothetical protein U1F46_02665 [Marinagarivorans sp.]
MSLDLTFNQPLIDAFKKDINYPALISQAPAPAFIEMDWPAALAHLKDDQGVIWQGQLQPAISADFGMGASASGILRSGIHQIKIEVVSLLAKDWQGRVDSIVRALTLTNNTSVNAKPIHSTADLFFIPKYTSEQTFCTFLVANFYVDLSAIDTADVRPVAQALLKTLLAHRQARPMDTKPVFTLAPKQQQASVGGEFSVTVNSLLPGWQILQPTQLPTAILWTGGEHNTFTFKATTPGVHSIGFVAVHQHTFLLAKDSLDVEVK